MTVQFIGSVGSPRGAQPCRPIGDVLRTIDASFAQPLNLDTPRGGGRAERVAFHRAFSQRNGCRRTVISLVRIRRAQDLCAPVSAPSVVATDVGFFDQSHLCRHFRRVLGITPRDYVVARTGGAPVRPPSTRLRANAAKRRVTRRKRMDDMPR